jgi:hypothetical protein
LDEKHEWAPRLSSIGTKGISATWLVTASCPKEAEQVILNDPVDVGMEIVEGEERCLTSARQFKAAFFSW